MLFWASTGEKEILINGKRKFVINANSKGLSCTGLFCSTKTVQKGNKTYGEVSAILGVIGGTTETTYYK